MRPHLATALSALFFLGCGPGSPGGPDAGADAGAGADGGGDFDFAGFAAQVRAAVQSVPARHCATAMPAVTLGPGGLREAVATFLAQLEHVSPSGMVADAPPCGGSGRVDCAHAFIHYLYKSDGQLADALLPTAQVVEARGSGVESVIWTPTFDGGTGAAAITTAGAASGRLLGIAFFNDPVMCPP